MGLEQRAPSPPRMAAAAAAVSRTSLGSAPSGGRVDGVANGSLLGGEAGGQWLGKLLPESTCSSPDTFEQQPTEGVTPEVPQGAQSSLCGAPGWLWWIWGASSPSLDQFSEAQMLGAQAC